MKKSLLALSLVSLLQACHPVKNPVVNLECGNTAYQKTEKREGESVFDFATRFCQVFGAGNYSRGALCHPILAEINCNLENQVSSFKIYERPKEVCYTRPEEACYSLVF